MQPGGDASNIKDTELQRPSAQNEYLSESWPSAMELRKRFSEQFLQEAIGTNVIYFSSPSLDHWRKLEVQLREHLQEFCLRQTYRLISTVRPKRILLLGWDTLEQMGAANFRELVSIGSVNGRRRRKRLLQFGKIQSIPTFAIPQPFAGWKFPPVTDEDWQAIAAEIDALGRW